MSKKAKTQNPPSPAHIIAEITGAIMPVLDMQKLPKIAASLIQDKFGFDYVGIFLVDEDNNQILLHAQSGAIGQNEDRLELNADSGIGRCILKSQSQMVSGESKTLLPETRSEMVIPLIGSEMTIGALSIQSVKVDAFSPEEQNILQTVASHLAAAIENAQVFSNIAGAQRVAEDLLHETIALQQLSQALSGTLDADQIVEIFFQTCTKMLGFDFAIFSLVDAEKQRVKAIAGAGVTTEHIQRANHPLGSDDIMADIIRTGQTEVITGWDDRFDQENFDVENMADWGLRIFTPIRLRQKNIGLVEVGYNKKIEAEIEESQIRLLRAFIDQTALALDNAQRHAANQRAIRREALIKEITTKVRGSSTVDAILQTAVKEIGDALHAKRTYIHLVSPSNGHNA